MTQPSFAAPVTLHLLGLPALDVGDATRPSRRRLGAVDALLLAVLAHHGPQPRQRLAALLWPDHAHPARNLRQRIHQLKKIAGSDLLQGDVSLALADGVRVLPPPHDAELDNALQVDPQAFDGVLLHGVQARDDLGELAEQLSRWRSVWTLRLQQALHRAAGAAGAAQVAGHSAQALALAGLALDDLHFADRASLDLLAPLIGDLALCTTHGVDAELSFGWLLAARADELAASAPGPAWQRDTTDTQWCVLPLPELDGAGVLALLRTLPLGEAVAEALAPRLYKATGGNPLYVPQTVATLVADDEGGDADGGARLSARLSARLAARLSESDQPLPAAEAALRRIAHRIGQIDAGARSLLRLAALAGADFGPDLASAVLGVPALALADDWRALEAAQLLHGNVLAHDLVRQAALHGVALPLQQATHRAVAQALDRPGSAVARARHWQAGAAWPQAAQAWAAAAGLARQRQATAEEVALLRAALHCAEQALAEIAAGADPDRAGDDASPALLGLQLADALLRHYLPDAAVATLQRIQPACRSDDLRLRWLLLHAKALAELQQAEASLASADAALQLIDQAAADSPQHAVQRLRAQQRRAMALLRLGRTVDALAAMPADPPPLDGLPADERLFWLCDRALLLDHADQRRQAVQAHRRVIAEAEAQRRWLPAADACSNLAVALLYLGRLHEGTAVGERSIEFSRRAGLDDAHVLIDTMNLAGNWRDLGWFDRCLAAAQPLPAQLRAAGLGFWAPNAENDLAVAYSRLGRDDLAWSILRVMDEGIDDTLRAARLVTRLRLARELQAERLAPQPAALLQQAEALLQRGGNRSGMLRLALALERAALVGREVGGVAGGVAGAEWAHALGQQAQDSDNLMLAVAALRLRGRLLLAAGQTDAAAAATLELLQLCEPDGTLPTGGDDFTQPTAVYAPELWWQASRALAATDAPLAARLVDQAGRWIDAAARRVPDTYRTSFLQRNVVNRAVHAAMAQRR